jgi:hypothetical protein
METYRMKVSEDEEAAELLVDVYNIDEVIETTERVPYDEYALTSTTESSPDPRETEATADVAILDVQITRVEGAFEVRLLGDREELAAERIADADWGLTSTA